MPPIDAQDNRKSALATAEQACQLDSIGLLNEARSQFSNEDIQKLYHRITYQAIRCNATRIIKELFSKGINLVPHIPTFMADATTETLQILLDNGWDINARDPTEMTVRYPFLWLATSRKDLVEWALKHGAHTSIQFSECETLRTRLLHKTLLEACIENDGSIPTNELLRTHGAPHGRRELHLAVERATYGLFLNETEEHHEKWHRERMAMVRHLLDVVKLDVNEPDQPADIPCLPDHCGGNGRKATPICYIPNCGVFPMDTRELTWLLLDHGADVALALEFAKRDSPKFIEDVEAWRNRKRSRKCCVQ